MRKSALQADVTGEEYQSPVLTSCERPERLDLREEII